MELKKKTKVELD